jgi:hypothetical protein
MSSLVRAAPALALCVLLLSPPPAYAQDVETIPVPLVEISSGYMFMRDFSDDLPGNDGINFPAGWYVSGAVNPNRWLGLVGEVTGSYKNNLQAATFEGLRFSNKLRLYTVMGGPRFFHKVGRVVPFAQVLTGIAHGRMETTLPMEMGATKISDTFTDFALQPGGGATVYLTRHVGVRMAADYRVIVDFVESGENYLNEFRVTAGFTLQWGG